MLFISLGCDCCVKTRINEYFYKDKKVESQFFDWILSDFHTVLTVLKSILNNTKVIENENFIFSGNATDTGNHIINLKNMYFTSIHDIKSKMDIPSGKQQIHDKYVRRFNRLKTILENESGYVYFICNIDNENPIQFGNMNITINDLETFKYLVEQINDKLLFKLFVITPNLTEEEYDKIIIINPTKTTKDHPKDWYRWYYDWGKIMEKIKSNI